MKQPTSKLTDQERTELLDWVSACQSAYHIDSTPGHRFGGLPSNLQENRDGLIAAVESILQARAVLRPTQDVLRICPLKDSVCGDRPDAWCEACPKQPTKVHP